MQPAYLAPMRLTKKQQGLISPNRKNGLAKGVQRRHTTNLLKQLGDEEYIGKLREGIDKSVVSERAKEAVELFDALGAGAEMESAFRAATLEGLAVAQMLSEHKLMPAIVQHCGLLFALEVLIASEGYVTNGGFSSPIRVVKSSKNQIPHIDRYVMLRDLLCAAPQADYDAARDYIASKFPDLTENLQQRFCFAFPEEDWGDKAILSGNWWIEADGQLLTTIRDPDVVDAYIDKNKDGEFGIAVATAALDIVSLLPPERAFRILEKAVPNLLGHYSKKEQKKAIKVIEAMQALCDPDVIDEALVSAIGACVTQYVDHKMLGPAAAAFFDAVPEARGSLKGGEAEVLAERLDGAGVAGATPKLLAKGLYKKKLPKLKSVVIDSLKFGSEESVLPIADAPVMLGHYKPKPLADVTLHPLEGAALARWKVIREQTSSAAADFFFFQKARGETREETYHEVPSELGIPAHNAGAGSLEAGPLRWLKLHGLRVVDGFLHEAHWEYYEDADYHDVIAHIESPRIAIAWVEQTQHRSSRRRAFEWIDTHRQVTIEGILPYLFDSTFGVERWHEGPQDSRHAKRAKKRQQCAISVAEHLFGLGEGPAFVKAAAHYGQEVQDAVAELVARDPLALWNKPRKLTAFIQVSTLPKLELAAGGTLSKEATEDLLSLLTVAPRGYAGHAELRAAFDAASLDAFLAGLVEAWGDAGAGAKDDWILEAALVLGGEQCAKQVADLTRRFGQKKEDAARRIGSYLVEMALLDDARSPVAIMTLGHVNRSTRYSNLKTTLEGWLDEIASKREMSRDELEDHAMSDAGMDRTGRLDVSFGDRALFVEVDSDLLASSHREEKR